MKTKALLVLTVLIAACMICSCGGGSGSGSESAQKAVAVSFDIDISSSVENVLSVSDHDFSTIEIWYKATPKWSSTELGTSIQGTTSNAFVKLTVIDATHPENNKFTYDNPSGTVGYFAQGKWEFEIEVRKPHANNTYAVLWKTAAPETKYVNETENSFDFTVVKNIDASKTGTITFDVTTNKKSTSDFFEVSYAPLGGGTSVSVEIGSGKPLVATGTGDVTADEAKLSGSVDLPSGFYAITVKYYSAASKLVGKSTVATEVLNGDTVTIDGTIENQVYQNTSFTIKGMYKLTLEVEASKITGETTVGFDDLATVGVDTELKFTATPTLTDLAGNAVSGVSPTYYYIWNNGESSTTNTFSYTPTAPGAFYVDCIVYYMSGTSVVGSSSTTFRFKAE